MSESIHKRARLAHRCGTFARVSDAVGLNPMQQQVLAALAKPAGWEPLGDDVVAAVRAQLHAGVAHLADRLEEGKSLWVSKHALATVHACERNHAEAGRDFEWSIATIRGTVLHRCIELAVNWRGDPSPADVVDESLAQYEASPDGSAGDWIAALPPGERALLRGQMVDLYSKFEECFPPLQRSWRPVVESSARHELLDGHIVLATRSDLTLGAVGSRVIIDVKSGAVRPVHREDLRFYALVETLRTGKAPRLLASYSLVSARPDTEEVTAAVLDAAVRRTVDGISAIADLSHGLREPEVRPGPTCTWCPLREECRPGREWLAIRDDPDAADD